MQKIKYAYIHNHIEEGGATIATGRDGITLIIMNEKKGPMDYLPYVQIYKGNHLHAEYALHNIVGVEYEP